MSIEQMTAMSVFFAVAAVVLAAAAFIFYRKKDLKNAGYVLHKKIKIKKKKKQPVKTQKLEHTQETDMMTTVCLDEKTTLLEEQEESWKVIQNITYVSEAADHFSMGSVR